MESSLQPYQDLARRYAVQVKKGATVTLSPEFVRKLATRFPRLPEETLAEEIEKAGAFVARIAAPSFHEAGIHDPAEWAKYFDPNAEVMIGQR